MIESFMQRRYGEPCVAYWDREVPELAAKIAADLASRWGAVAGTPDGEDKAGRQRMRLQTPAELTARACETAELLVAELRRRGWLHVTPSAAPSAKESEG